jgi:hypothetical protein
VEVFFYTGWFFAHPRIAKIEPALYTRKPEESRIPESFLFGTARLADTLRR